MVRFSKKEDYAVILVNKLVAEFNNRFVPLSEVAQENKISILFLRNIALDLRKAGIITSQEGKNGGYKLAKNPQKIQFGELLRAVSNRPLFTCCQKTKDGMCNANLCPHGPSLSRIKNEFFEKIYNLSLVEFVNYKFSE